MAFNLTDAQKAALDINQNIFVEAGAGSGKTMVMVTRYVKLLQEVPNLKPENILVITFTNKAADELKERIQKQYPLLNEHRPKITTIHGFCSSTLKTYSIEAGLDPAFEVMEDSQSRFLIQDTLKQRFTQWMTDQHPSLKTYLRYLPIHRLEKELLNILRKRHLVAQVFTDALEVETDPLIKELILAIHTLFNDFLSHYETVKHRLGKVDYDDLLEKTNQLLYHQPTLKTLQHDIQYIMVDEFQDTDPLQWNIIQLLCDEFSPLTAKKLFLVGDVKQSIYGFRGAKSDFFESAMTQFSQEDVFSKVVPMSDNFRTQEGVIDWVNTLFSDLFQKSETSPISYTPLKAQRQALSTNVDFRWTSEKGMALEGEQMVEWIQAFKKQGYDYSDCCILLRRKSGFSDVQTTLNAHGIPTQLHAKTAFLELPESEVLLNIIHMLIQPYDPAAVLGVLKSSLFNVSDQALYWLASTHPKQPLLHQLRDSGDDFLNIYQQINHWITLAQTEPISRVIEKASRPINTPITQRFLSWFSDCEAQHEGSRWQLWQRLLTEIKTKGGPSINPTSTGVHLMTIHASKGLEYPLVIVGECHHPFNMSKSDPMLLTPHGLGLSLKAINKESVSRETVMKKHQLDVIEEEKRLFYVACTRAKDHLLLTGFMDKGAKASLLDQSYLDFLYG